MEDNKNGAPGRVTAEEAPAVRREGGVVWLQVLEAARRLGVTRGRIYHLITARRFHTCLFDGLLYVREQDVKLYRVLRREHQKARVATLG